MGTTLFKPQDVSWFIYYSITRPSNSKQHEPYYPFTPQVIAAAMSRHVDLPTTECNAYLITFFL